MLTASPLVGFGMPKDQWIPVPYIDTIAAEKLFRYKIIRLLKSKHLLSDERIELLDSFGCNSHTDTAGSLPTAYRHDIVESRNLRLVGMCEQGPGSLEAIALHESSEG